MIQNGLFGFWVYAYRKRDKNGEKRLEIAKFILFHVHKHCKPIL